MLDLPATLGLVQELVNWTTVLPDCLYWYRTSNAYS